MTYDLPKTPDVIIYSDIGYFDDNIQKMYRRDYNSPSILPRKPRVEHSISEIETFKPNFCFQYRLERRDFFKQTS